MKRKKGAKNYFERINMSIVHYTSNRILFLPTCLLGQTHCPHHPKDQPLLQQAGSFHRTLCRPLAAVDEHTTLACPQLGRGQTHLRHKCAI